MAASLMEQAALLATGESTPTPQTGSADEARALGWALKDLCYASWSNNPQTAVRAALALRRIQGSAPAPANPADGAELDALVAWTDGIACAIRGEMEDAAASFDVAAAAFVGLGQMRHAAQTQVPKIMALAMLGRHDESMRCAESALCGLLDTGDTATASKVLLNLGNLHLRADRYAAAAERLLEAATLFERLEDHEAAVMADIGLADALTATGRLDEALARYERARDRATAHGFPVLQALVTESLALLDLARGHYRDALAGLEASRRSYAALDMPQHLAIAVKQLADAYLELRLLPESLAGFDAALDRFKSLDMQTDRAWTLVQRGRALALAGQRAASRASLDEASLLFVDRDNTAGAAAVALAQAELSLAEDDGKKALALARDAAGRFQSVGLIERQLRADTVQAQAMLRMGEVRQASTLFNTTLLAARARQLLPVQLRCLTGRAMAACGIEPAGVIRQDLESAAALFEDQRRTLPGDEIRSAFQQDHLLPFQELLRLDLEAHEAGQADAARVLQSLDRFRARTLVDRVGDDEAGGGAARDSADPAHAGTKDLRAQLAWLHRRQQRLQDDATSSSALAAEVRHAEHTLLERTRRVRLAGPAPVHSTEVAEMDVGALQGLLQSGDALVEYGRQGDELFACVVTRRTVHVIRHLVRWPALLDTLQALRFQLDTLRHGEAPVKRHLSTLSERLHGHLRRVHDLIWRPLLAHLGDPTRVLVVPHADLGSVPFAALHDGTHYLVDHLQICLAPSAWLAARSLRQRPRAAARVVALGESSWLPHAAREAQCVQNLLHQGTAFVGEGATIENLIAHGWNADVIHIACHAQFRGDNPLFSALHLHDGLLTAESIEGLRLPGALVVLSGCDTAISATGQNEEMFGLTRAFLVAGASQVMASLWPIDDAMTVDLMSDFYGALRRGQASAVALRLAQLAARGRHPHPFHWASFSLTGCW